jgi:hypothetical protein
MMLLVSGYNNIHKNICKDSNCILLIDSFFFFSFFNDEIDSIDFYQEITNLSSSCVWW